MNNDNDLNLHSMTKLSGWLRYCHKVFIACHNLRLHMLKTCGIGKTVLSVSCVQFKSDIWKSRSSPTLRRRNICICPCLSRSTQISRLCPFSPRRQAELVNACVGALFIFSMGMHVAPLFIAL